MPHSKTQNVVFVCDTVRTEEHPRGEWLIVNIVEKLVSKNLFEKYEMDIWRDSGWSAHFQFNGGDFEIVVLRAVSNAEEWVLQVSCNSDINFIQRMMGNKFVDQTAAIYAISVEIFSILRDLKASNMRWCIDNLPDGKNESAEPVQVFTGTSD